MPECRPDCCRSSRPHAAATYNAISSADEEVRAVFARLTKMRLRWVARALVELRAMYAYMSNDDPAAANAP
jgi:hypothetical protein